MSDAKQQLARHETAKAYMSERLREISWERCCVKFCNETLRDHTLCHAPSWTLGTDATSGTRCSKIQPLFFSYAVL